jgi:hypothetical protein
VELVDPALGGYSRPPDEAADGGIGPRDVPADVTAAELGAAAFAKGYAGCFLIGMNNVDKGLFG